MELVSTEGKCLETNELDVTKETLPPGHQPGQNSSPAKSEDPLPPNQLYNGPGQTLPVAPGYQQPFPPYQQPGQPGFPPGAYFLPPGYQPSQPVNWMPAPERPPNCPEGLEYLTMVDQLLVHQQIELFELLSGIETENKYRIANTLGQQVYFAAESSDFCTRICCGPIRSFEMKILDNFQNEVLHFSRPLACGSCCFPCCLQSIEVSAPPGNVIGRVEQKWSLWPSFVVKNVQDDIVFKIKGPFCVCSCGRNLNFHITNGNGEEVGKITKQWGGMIREMCTEADNFGITFPMDLDVNMKATLLGALFLIDMMYFEQPANKN